jgi:glycosyltransferase involved in cell wall biosynthesis
VDTRFGGIATSLPRLCASTAGSHEFTIAAFCEPDERKPATYTERCNVIQLPRGRARWSFDKTLQTRLREIIRHADGLHIHGLWEEHCAVAASMAHDLDTPYVISAHGMLEDWAFRDKGLKKRLYSALVEVKNLRRAVCLRALTTAEVTDYRRLGLRNPVAVIPNGVEESPASAPTAFLEQFPELADKRLALYLGRFHHKKGLDSLCLAWSRLCSRHRDAHLVLAGDDTGVEADRIHGIARELGLDCSVTFTGMLRDDLKWSALAAASVFVLPSLSEGFSMAVLESLAAGVPPIITRACNFPEVEEKSCGWVIDPGDLQLEAALRTALSSPANALQEMAARGRELVRLRYSWQSVGVQMGQVYDWILGGSVPDCVEVH